MVLLATSSAVTQPAQAQLRIKRARVTRAQLGLHHRGGGRAEVVRRVRGDDDEIQLLRAGARALQGLAGGGHTQVRGGLIIRHHVALADAHVLHEPVTHGLADDAVHLGVGDDLLGDVAPGGEDVRVSHDAVLRTELRADLAPRFVEEEEAFALLLAGREGAPRGSRPWLIRSMAASSTRSSARILLPDDPAHAEEVADAHEAIGEHLGIHAADLPGLHGRVRPRT